MPFATLVSNSLSCTFFESNQMIPAKSFLPSIITQILNKYESLKNNNEWNSKIQKEFMIELDVVFGDVLKEALKILDEQIITIYTTSEKLKEVAEITVGRKSGLVVKLFPDTNYCACDHFLYAVLQIDAPLPSTAATITNRFIQSYTCEHVLALRLAKILNATALRYECVPQDKFNILLSILKNRKMLTQTQFSNFKFVGRLDSIKSFYAGIKALSFGEYGSFHISEDGFRISVEQGKTAQANLFITTSCFTEYHVVGVVTFSINMNIISECMGIFSGSDCSMKMFYKGEGAPLIIVLEPQDEEDITTECSIKTTHNEETIDFNLDDDSPSLNVVFVRGPDLANIFLELDKSAEELEITLSPKRPHFKINTLGVMQSESSVEVAKTSDMMMLFNCRATNTGRYKSSHIRLTQKALAVASKVAIKTDSSGLLEMHFMIHYENEAQLYVQFYISPLTDVEI